MASSSSAGTGSAGNRFTIIGAGASSSVPWLKCVIDPEHRCAVCAECMANPGSVNVRHNPSALVQFAHPDGEVRNILIDCGKTFRPAVMRSFPALGVSRVHAVLITHAHADAFMGMDDLRDISPDASLPVYIAENAFRRVGKAFGYLVAPPTGAGLFIASIHWRIFRPFEPFEVAGMIVTPLPVEHGDPRPMCGFEFRAADVEAAAEVPRPLPDVATTAAAAAATAAATAAAQRVVYISDVVGLPLDTRAYLLSSRIDLLILDALAYRRYPTHFGVKQSLACILDLCPTTVTFIGMNHRMDVMVEAPKLAAWMAELHATGCLPGSGGVAPSDDTLAVPPAATATGRPFPRTLPRVVEYGFDGWTAPIALAATTSVADEAAAVRGIRARAIAAALAAQPGLRSAAPAAAAVVTAYCDGGCVTPPRASSADGGYTPPSAALVDEVLGRTPSVWHATALSPTGASPIAIAASPSPALLAAAAPISPSVTSPLPGTPVPASVVVPLTAEAVDDALGALHHVLPITTYSSARFPQWEEGDSPSLSATTTFSVHYTTATGATIVRPHAVATGGGGGGGGGVIAAAPPAAAPAATEDISDGGCGCAPERGPR